MTDHEQYEVLCALAATGQLHTSEKANFDEHFLDCPACRDQLHDLSSVDVRLQFNAALNPIAASMPAGSVERFRARAIQEGVLPRAAPARPSRSYALASAAALFVILSSLVVMPHARKGAESFSIPAAASMSAPQTFPASVNQATLLPRASQVAHTLVVRHHVLRHANTGVHESTQAEQRFLQTIPSRYPFFGPQTATNSARASYPALNRSQISHLDLFRDLDDARDRNTEGMPSTGHPIDMASARNAFDFAANIRQLHFQLPIAQ
jgi:hypothetical protein